MCPTLGVTTSAGNGLGIGAATLFVLVLSNSAISLVKNLIPAMVRIPCYIVIIASFVTVVDLLMAAYLPELHAQLGIFIPLIVVNCIILGRAEAFAAKNSLFQSVLDAVGMGLGFTLGLTSLGIVREIPWLLFRFRLEFCRRGGLSAAAVHHAARRFHRFGRTDYRLQQTAGSKINELSVIFIAAIFVNNIVLSQFLGICPFLGVSKKISTALGMGFAVMFVMTLSAIVTFLIYYKLWFPIT